MIGKASYEFDVGDKKIGFKFNMYASSVTEKVAGVGISELLQIKNGRTVEMLLYYFWGGYVSWCAVTGNKEMDMSTFSDYLEEIGLEKLLTVYSESLGVNSKNGQAPKEAGQVSP